MNRDDKPRFLDLRDGGNLPEERTSVWPTIIALACLIVVLFVSIEKAIGQAAYDQIRAGQYHCGAC